MAHQQWKIFSQYKIRIMQNERLPHDRFSSHSRRGRILNLKKEAPFLMMHISLLRCLAGRERKKGRQKRHFGLA
jgi:hypothetical protein